MTFTIPEDLARQFLKHVQAQDRSHYVAEAIAAKLRERQNRLIRACEIANSHSDVLAIEQEWEALNATDLVEEPWSDAKAR
jgi:ubiquinone biosynthesis protein UbiJ